MAINKYTQAFDNALEQYIPLPFDTLMKAGQATQQRYDQSVTEDSALQTGLASIEARSPGYKQYVDKTIAGYRENMSGLIKQFNGRLDDPEFKRQAKEVQNRYANDPAFQTIKIGNEAIKRTQDIEARMRAEGKLYISDLPTFTGTDANGRLTAYNGSPSAVNTLEDWTKAGAIAHSSTEDIGTRTTNENNLKRWRETITKDTASQARLAQAYMQQGMTPEQAQNAVKSSIQGLVNQYGVESKVNTALLNYGLNVDQFNYQKQRDAANDKLKRDLAAQRATGKPVIDPSLPSVRQNQLPFTTGNKSDSKLNVPTFGSSTINTEKPAGNGLINAQGGFFRQAADAKSYNGVLAKQTGSFKLTNGVDKGFHNVAVDKSGNVITSAGKGEFMERNGKTFYKYTSKNKEGKMETFVKEAQPKTMKVYEDRGTGSIYYAPANEQEAMRYMGATGAYWEGRKSVGEQFNMKANTAAPVQLQNVVSSFDFSDPNTLQTLQSVGGSRGYDLGNINKAFIKTARGEKLSGAEAKLVDNILTDLTNINKYNQFNKGEFDNQGKRANINSPLMKTADDNTTGAKTQEEAYAEYLKQKEDE